MIAQWEEEMYSLYTYANYTKFEAFNSAVDPSSYDAGLLEAAIFYETNRQRVKHGLPVFQFDYALYVCTHNHSVDMVNHNFFSHTSVVEGKNSMTDRLSQVGYTNCWAAENIAYCDVKSSYATTAQKLLEMWMNSKGHRENILNPKYTHLGCGIALYYDENWLMVKATQNFVFKE